MDNVMLIHQPNVKFQGELVFKMEILFFSRITPCLENGKICQVRGLKNNIGFGSTEFLVFRGKPGVSDTDFVFYLARYEEVRKFAEQNMVGTSGRQRVGREAFENLILDLPPLPTQRRIAASPPSSPPWTTKSNSTVG